jgi:hypothetical protein
MTKMSLGKPSYEIYVNPATGQLDRRSTTMNADIKTTLDKAMKTMFAPVENVKYDLATGQTGIVTEGGLITLGSDDTIEQNPMDFFSLALPAFAVLTPVAQVRRGDIIVSQGKAYSFVLESGLKPVESKPIKPRGRRTKEQIAADEAAEALAREAEEAEDATTTASKAELSTINVQGHVSRFRPRKVQMMGINDGLTIVRSFSSMMTTAGTDSTNPLSAMLPMLLMSKMGNGKTDAASMLPLLMMMGGNMGGGVGGMMSNPFMLMALMGDGFDGFFKS